MKQSQILIVEDEGIIAKDLQRMLRGLGYDVPVAVGTGEKAILTAKLNQPDLILMDINLRGAIDGIEAAKVISAQQDVPIVYLTANSDEPTMQRAKITDPFGFLIKPFEERALHAGIEMALYKHRSEKRTREREHWLSTTLKSIADGVITTDEHGKITFLNEAGEAVLGWTHADSVGRHYTDIFPVTTDDSPHIPAGAVVLNGRHKQNVSAVRQLPLKTKYGAELQLVYSTAPIQYEDGRVAGHVIVFRDVSEQTKLEAELRQAQKLDAIGRLAGSIAHDFNNALTAMMGYSSLMLSRIPIGDSLHEDAGHILRAAEHSARLTRQLLTFSRKQLLSPTRMNLGQTVVHVQGLLRRLIRENIALTVVVDDDLWPIIADPGECEQIVINMAVNARDAMPEGGSLHIGLSKVSLGATEAESIRGASPGDFVALQFSDTGIGMSQETMDRIFEPFFTTKPADRGTGLGLSTCERIIKRSGGFIHVASVLGSGTTFTIYFPRTESGAPPAEKPFEAEPSASTANETILVVEDEEAVRIFTARVLEELGYTVVEAADGCDALKELSMRPSGFDLIIADLLMPHMGGRQFVESARAFADPSCDVRVLFMSGYTDEDIIGDPAFGFEVAFLQKPFTVEILARTVRGILNATSSSVCVGA